MIVKQKIYAHSPQHGGIFGTLFNAPIGPNASKEIFVWQVIIGWEQL